MDAVSDLAFFDEIARSASLTAAARELGVTTPAVSRRLAALERRLGVCLLVRTTRSLLLTHEGERYLQSGRRILDDLHELERALRGGLDVPQGQLRVNATFGFGRRQIAPLLARFVQRYPLVSVQLSLSERMPLPGEGQFDVSIRFGPPPDARLCARRIVNNRRILCAAPAYLAANEPIGHPRDLARHQCLFVRENHAAYGVWQLHNGTQQEQVRVAGRLSANDGESVVNWGIGGAGVMLRSQWDVGEALRDGRLQRVLPGWSGAPADIYALYPEAMTLSPRVRAFVDFLCAHFAAANLSGVA